MTSPTHSTHSLQTPVLSSIAPFSKSLITLPEGYEEFDEFNKKFNLGSASTEQRNPITEHLGEITHEDPKNGVQLLLNVDKGVIEGFKTFNTLFQHYSVELSEKLNQGGRIFLVGCGSSGRVALDIAAKCNKTFAQDKGKVIGVIAGGDSALIRAKEGFEDSLDKGRESLESFHLTENDIVFSISASGSATFNVGASEHASKKGARVFYFYNSKKVPERTEKLFKLENPVIPLCVDIGAQAITGSTRLQGATIAECCLGSLITSAFYLKNKEKEKADSYPQKLLENMQKAIALLEAHKEKIASFAKLEEKIFSSPTANFRKITDELLEGYVTFLAEEDSIREVLIDNVETSPTFSTNPNEKESIDNQKRSEFRAYHITDKDNAFSFETALGTEVHDHKDISDFILSSSSDGKFSLANRPTGKGNLVVGVAKIKEEEISQALLSSLDAAQEKGALTGMIILCRKNLSEKQRLTLEKYDTALILENIPFDEEGFSETILLKLILNAISNTSMILMNKVLGNLMIDVSASNNKLIDRAHRLIRLIWGFYQTNALPLSEKELYHMICHLSSMKKSYREKGLYTPSLIKIILTMIASQKSIDDFDAILQELSLTQENVPEIIRKIREYR